MSRLLEDFIRSGFAETKDMSRIPDLKAPPSGSKVSRESNGSTQDEQPAMAEIHQRRGPAAPVEVRRANVLRRGDSKPSSDEQSVVQRIRRNPNVVMHNSFLSLAERGAIPSNEQRELEHLQLECEHLYQLKERINADAIKLSSENRSLRTSIQKLEDRLLEENENRRKLEEHIIELKQDLSKIGHSETQVSDEFLIEETRQLAYRIQNWVVKSTRNLKLSPSPIRVSQNTNDALSKVLPNFKAVELLSKCHVFQALIAQVATDIFESDTLSDSQHEVSATTLSKKFEDIQDQTRFIQWRSTTFGLLYEMGDDALENFVRERTQRAAETIDGYFGEFLGTPPSTERQESIQRLLFSAIKLSRVLRVQRARLRIKMPTLDSFSPHIHEDEWGQEAPEKANQQIEYVLFPMLVRYSTQSTEERSSHEILMRARVVCFEEDEANEEEDDLAEEVKQSS